MTAHTTETEPVDNWKPGKGDPDGIRRRDVRPRDWALEAIFDMAFGFDDEKEESSFGATVSLKGQTVSGMVISRRTWATLQVEELRASGDGGKILGDFLDAVVRGVTESNDAMRERRSKADLPNERRRYFHMRDARIGAGAVFTAVPLWRGQMDEIDGWSLGSHNAFES